MRRQTAFTGTDGPGLGFGLPCDCGPRPAGALTQTSFVGLRSCANEDPVWFLARAR
jgi:hypothetical protein